MKHGTFNSSILYSNRRGPTYYNLCGKYLYYRRSCKYYGYILNGDFVDEYEYYKRKVLGEPTKGTTKLEELQETNLERYPKNGHIGGYWYYYIGIK